MVSVVYSLLQPSSSELMSLTYHLRSLSPTWRHLLSRYWHLRITPKTLVLCSTAVSKPLPVKWHHFWVTSCHFRPSDFISCHELAPPPNYSPVGAETHKMWVLGLLWPSPGHFRWNDATSKPLLVTSSHMTWFPVTRKAPPATYSPVGSEMHPKHGFPVFYSCLQPISRETMWLLGDFWWLDTTWHHFLSHASHLVRVTAL